MLSCQRGYGYGPGPYRPYAAPGYGYGPAPYPAYAGPGYGYGPRPYPADGYGPGPYSDTVVVTLSQEGGAEPNRAAINGAGRLTGGTHKNKHKNLVIFLR